MLKKILIGLGAALAGLLVVIAFQPATFHIERSINVSAPAAAAFAQVNDFHAWGKWSPWEKLDPGMKRTYEGPSSGVGAKYAWVGSKEVGEGRMTIEQSEPSRIAIKLEFLKPFAATNIATFSFVPADQGSDFMGKAFHLFMDMEKMIGPDFEKGLADLKTAAEAATKPDSVAGRTP
jgi:hypothetical protein